MFWVTRKIILMTSVSMSILWTSVRIISRLRCQLALANSPDSGRQFAKTIRCKPEIFPPIDITSVLGDLRVEI